MTYDIRASSEPESQEKLEVRMNMRKQARFVAVALGLVILAIVVVNTSGQEDVKSSDPVAGEQWEYLAVAGPSSTNLTATGNPRMRKEPDSAFGREAFVLEKHLDKLGANGWELIAVAGVPTDPVYYFKRQKRTETSR
jgi:hypothetical protein